VERLHGLGAPDAVKYTTEPEHRNVTEGKRGKRRP
jgi:hypothetical protein